MALQLRELLVLPWATIMCEVGVDLSPHDQVVELAETLVLCGYGRNWDDANLFGICATPWSHFVDHEDTPRFKYINIGLGCYRTQALTPAFHDSMTNHTDIPLTPEQVVEHQLPVTVEVPDPPIYGPVYRPSRYARDWAL